MHLPLAVCLLAIAAATAVEPEAAARSEAKALHTEALRANDLWTVMQVEAWAAGNDLRLRPALPGVTVIGDPLFAAPARIDLAADLGERLVVAAGTRVHQWAADGRPLARSRALPFDPWRVACGFAGSHLALAMSRRIDATSSTISLATIPLAEGEPVVKQDVPGQFEEKLRELLCADDGSAVVVQSDGITAEKKPVKPRLLIAHRGGHRVLDGWHDPLALGRGGIWIAAQRPGEETRTLLAPSGEHPFRSLAAGPGVAMMLREGGACDLVQRDGSIVAFEPPIGLGKDAEVATVGEWLVFASGKGATTRPSLDLLGNPVGGGEPQPPTCAWLRWSDLLEDPAAPPAGREPIELCLARSYGAALLRWQDNQIDIVDLAGADPVIRPFVTASAAVRNIEWADHCAVVELADQAWQVFDAQRQPTAERGKIPGIPVWSLATAVAQPNGAFLIVY